MLLRMVLAAALSMLLAHRQEALAAPPSWCKHARSETERAICARGELWALDACEDRLYRKAQASAAPPDGRKAVDAAEKAWIAARDLCGSDSACIAQRYRERAARLDPLGGACANLAATPLAAGPRCDVAPPSASGTRIASPTGKTVAYGEKIEVNWQLPPVEAMAGPMFLIGAMSDGVRFEGEFRYTEDGLLEYGPGFMAITGASRAPFGIKFGAGRTRVIIPMHDPDVDRSGRLWIKPYIAGPLSVEWAVVAVNPGCPGGEASQLVTGPSHYEVAAGAPQIIVQDFVTPDPLLELATPSGSQPLKEVELSADGHYRLEIFPRRYRVYDQTNGAKLVDRSGVQPRFSPSSRFVIASVGDAAMLHPTNFELIDLVAGRPVRNVTGPIVGWSNGDALLLDAGRAYQAVDLIGTLVEPQFSEEGHPHNTPAFFPGCGTCDAWTGSNIRIDWDRLTALRGDSDNPAAAEIAGLATGRKVDGGPDKAVLAKFLSRAYGQPQVKLATGWASDAPLKLTHVGRGYEGYADDESLQPSQAGRASQTTFLQPRRLALTEGRVLRAADLRPVGATRSPQRAGWTPVVRGGPPVLDKGYVADELARLGLRSAAIPEIPELPIPQAETQWGGGEVIRAWPAALKAEVLAASPAAKSWFSAQEEDNDVIVAAWRLEHQGAQYLLLQHGMPAMTANGAHDLKFDLLALNGAARGQIHTFSEISGLYSQFVGREHTVARVMAKGDGRVIIAIPGSGKAAVVALGGGHATSAIDMVEPTLLCGFHDVAGRGLVMQGNCDGQLFVYDPASGPSPIVSARVVDEELIVYNAQGYYAATYEGAHFVHVAFPGLPGVHSFEQFAKTLERPDVIRGIIGGSKEQLPAPRLLPPPEIELAAGAGTPGKLVVVVDQEAGSALSALEVYVDGRLEENRKVAGAQLRATIAVPRRPYMRGVTVVAVDNNGFRSRPVTLNVGPGSGGRNTLHVVAVGIDEYDRMAPLEGAKYDAETLVAALKSSALAYYGEVKAAIRANRDATAAAVEADLRAAVEAAGPDDTVLVFYAGHGGKSGDGRYFLTTSQTDPERLAETAIDWSSMADVLGKARGRVIAVLDACHSGQTERVLSTNDEAVASLTSAAAPMVILAASKGRQLSEEMPAEDGGVFTQNLARLIGRDRKSIDADGDGVLEISELYRSLKQAVVATTDGRQTPWLVRRNVVGDAPLF